MADLADEAQRQEQAILNAALAAAQPRGQEPQRIKDGQVVCIDCGEPIPPARLAAVLGACRCAACQEDHEGHVA